MIAIHGIEARGRHGVLAAERELGQPFIVDIEMDVDVTAASHSDDLADTVNYADVALAAVRIIEGPPFHLIERLAGAIADDVLSLDRVDRVTVTVHKPQAPIPAAFGDVTVTVVRP